METVLTFGRLYPVGPEKISAFAVIPLHSLGWLLAQCGAHKLSEAVFPQVYASLKPLQQSQWNDRIISQLHCLVTATAAWRLLLSGAHPIGHPSGAPAPAGAPWVSSWQSVVQFSLGYYLFDIARMLYNKHGPPKMDSMDPEFGQNVAHHTIMLMGHAPVLLNRQVIGISAFGYLAEMSTPVLNCRFLMQRAGLTGTPAFRNVTKLLAALFLVFRVLLFPAALVLCAGSGMPWPGKGAHLLLWALNMAGNAVWFKALLKSVAKGDKLAREEKDGAGRKKGAAAPAKRD